MGWSECYVSLKQRYTRILLSLQSINDYFNVKINIGPLTGVPKLCEYFFIVLFYRVSYCIVDCLYTCIVYVRYFCIYSYPYAIPAAHMSRYLFSSPSFLSHNATHKKLVCGLGKRVGRGGGGWGRGM